MWVASHIEMPPDEINKIELCTVRKDKFGRPTAKLHIRSTWTGFESTLDRSKKVLRDIARRAEGTNIGEDPFQLWACHPMGGCSMSRSSHQGVVDANLKAWESPNTYVLSLGVFPTGAAVNPTLTLLALAHRLRDHLLNTL